MAISSVFLRVHASEDGKQIDLERESDRVGVITGELEWGQFLVFVISVVNIRARIDIFPNNKHGEMIYVLILGGTSQLNMH